MCAAAGASMLRFHLRREHVTLAPHGPDDDRLPGVLVKAMTQAAYLHIDGAVERSGIARHQQIDQLVAVQNPVGMAEEYSQKLVFRRAQRHHDALWRNPGARRNVER